MVVLGACSDDQERPGRDVRSFGDVTGDGSSTWGRAVSAARREGFAVEVPAGVEVRLTAPVVLPGGVMVRGRGSIISAGDLRSLLRVKGSGARLSGVGLAGAEGEVGTLVEVESAARDVRMEAVTLEGARIGVAVASGARDISVVDSSFERLSCGVSLRGSAREIAIRACQFREWRDRAVWVVGGKDSSPQQVTISRCTIGPPDPRGEVRQPIQINGQDRRLISDVSITNNEIRGPGTSYQDRRRPGAADLISLHRCRKFVVAGNRVSQGGDVGITVSRQSRDGVVEDNVCTENDSVGICIGSRSSTEVSDIVVRGNVCEDNGKDRARDGRPWARAGILVVRGRDIDLVRNVLRDTGSGTQVNAISLKASRVSLKENSIASPGVSVLTDGDSRAKYN